ncbi:MAG: hypothetical protein WC483_00250 [Candidatus Paceibacterota bacterium]
MAHKTPLLDSLAAWMEICDHYEPEESEKASRWLVSSSLCFLTKFFSAEAAVEEYADKDSLVARARIESLFRIVLLSSPASEVDTYYDTIRPILYRRGCLSLMRE